MRYFTEKEFYLEEFRGRTLLLSIAGEALNGSEEGLAQVLEELAKNQTRLILLVGGPAEKGLEPLRSLMAKRLQVALSECGRQTLPLSEFSELPAVSVQVKSVWSLLRDFPLFMAVHRGETARLAGVATELAVRLKVHKLVIVEPEGGLKDEAGRSTSFIDAPALGELLSAGGGDRAGIGSPGCSKDALEAAKLAVEKGVGSVSICSLDGLYGELFSYQGTGTLCTLEHYCRVERVGIDDFREVERFIRRGQDEGILRPRSSEEIAEVLPNTWGATIGAHHLAGICALETFHGHGRVTGEVVALYTVSRFKGEGIGSRLLAAVVSEAKGEGLQYLFACTTVPHAIDFFIHNGFARIALSAVPPERWRGYDSARRSQLTALGKEL